MAEMEAPADESNVTPEEQQQYELVMDKAAELIYQGDTQEVLPQILQALEPAREPAGDPSGGNPAILALANAATQVVSKLDASSREAGQPIDDGVLYHAGSEIVEMLAEIAETAKIHDYSQEEIDGAFIQAVDNYRPIAEEMGRTDADTLKGQFEEVKAADQQGKLGELLPGLGEGEAPAE